jgi:hypothetical protein
MRKFDSNWEAAGGKFLKRRTRLKGGGEKPIINSPVTGENKRRG